MGRLDSVRNEVKGVERRARLHIDEGVNMKIGSQIDGEEPSDASLIPS